MKFGTEFGLSGVMGQIPAEVVERARFGPRQRPSSSSLFMLSQTKYSICTPSRAWRGTCFSSLGDQKRI